MIFVTYDYKEEGEQGCGFFKDLEEFKQKKLLETEDRLGFFVYYQDGIVEEFSRNGEMTARRKI